MGERLIAGFVYDGLSVHSRYPTERLKKADGSHSRTIGLL